MQSHFHEQRGQVQCTTKKQQRGHTQNEVPLKWKTHLRACRIYPGAGIECYCEGPKQQLGGERSSALVLLPRFWQGTVSLVMDATGALCSPVGWGCSSRLTALMQGPTQILGFLVLHTGLFEELSWAGEIGHWLLKSSNERERFRSVKHQNNAQLKTLDTEWGFRSLSWWEVLWDTHWTFMKSELSI